METENKFASVKAIFFDASDTLYTNKRMEDAYPHHAAGLLAKTRNIPHGEAEQLLKETMEQLKGKVKHVSRVRAMAEFGFSKDDVHRAYARIKPHEFLEEDKELDAVMAKLAKKYTLGIISNTYESHLVDIMDALGVAQEWFHHLVTADKVKEIKPDPEPFLKAVELSCYAPDECLFVADSPTKDIRPAKEVGMKTVLVKENPTEQDRVYADAVISGVKDIITVL